MENKDIDTCKLLYNTERVRLYIPEYGRNVQKMVDYLKTIEDREKRNEQARAIIKVMEILNPAVHLEEDFEHKLWDHLFIISGFDLDMDAPYPMPAPESLNHNRPYRRQGGRRGQDSHDPSAGSIYETAVPYLEQGYRGG